MKTLKTALAAVAVLAVTVVMAAGNNAPTAPVKESKYDTVPKKDTTKKDTSKVEFRLR